MIMQLDLCKEAAKKCRADKISDGFIRNTRIAKTVIDILVGNCIDSSKAVIEKNNLSDLQQVYDADGYIISLSSDAEKSLRILEKFLHKNMYEHNAVKSVSVQVAGWLEKVFDKFLNDPKLMPKYYQSLIDEFGIQRTICDYISGMTDWYCLSIIKATSEN
jgi:dGTPase